MCALTLLGCLQARDGHLPQPEGAVTWILISDYDLPTARAMVVDSPATNVALRSRRTLALAYALSAEHLQLPLNKAFAPVPKGRALPKPLQGSLLDETGRWQAASNPLEAVRGFLLPPLNMNVCVRRGGCLTQTEPLHCQTPCDVTSPATPALPNRPCPEGWLATPTKFDGPDLCAPQVPAPLGCEPGKRQSFGTSTCIDLYPCPSGPWPQAPPGATTSIYVRSGALAGDGSAQAPFDRLSLALATAPPGAAILIGEGTLFESADIDVADVHLVGLCPQRTAIHAPMDGLSLSGQGVRIEGLTVRSDRGTAVHITSTASVTLEGVDLISPDGVGVRSSGDLRVREFRVQSPLGVLLSGGQASLSQGQFIDGTAARCEGQADLHLESLTANLSGAEAPTDAVSLSDCGQVSLHSLSVHDVPGWGINGGQYHSLEIQDLHVVRASEGGLVLNEKRRTSQAHLQRVYIEATERGGIGATTQNLSIEDLSLRALPSPGLYLTPPQDPPPATGFSIDGLWTEDVGGPVVVAHHVEGAPFEYPMRFDDVVISEVPDSEGDEPAASLRQDIAVTLYRWWVASSDGCGLFIGCAPTTAHDLTIHAQGRCGALVEAASGTSFNRFRISGRTESALELVGSDSCLSEDPVITEDLSLVGTASRGVGARLAGGAVWKATRFDVSGYATGIDASNAGALKLSDGAIRNNGLGLQLPQHLNAQDVLTHVGFDNEQNLRQR